MSHARVIREMRGLDKRFGKITLNEMWNVEYGLEGSDYGGWKSLKSFAISKNTLEMIENLVASILVMMTN